MNKLLAACLLAAACHGEAVTFTSPGDGVRRATGVRELTGAERREMLANTPTATRRSVAVAAILPSSIDNSASRHFPPIGDQGGLGSCAQFAAIYYALTHELSLVRPPNARGYALLGQRIMSPKWTYNLLNRGSNGGTWMTHGWDITRAHGCATLAEVPYDGRYNDWCTVPGVWTSALARKSFGSYRLEGLNTDGGLHDLKNVLCNGHVPVFATYIFSWQNKALSNNPKTSADDAFVGQQCGIAVTGSSGGHAMTIVGYNDNVWCDENGNKRVDAGELGALKIANSWGPKWANNGFTWLSYSALRKPRPALWDSTAYWVVGGRPRSAALTVALRFKAQNRSEVTVAVCGDGQYTETITYPALDFRAGGSVPFDGTMAFDITPLSDAKWIRLSVTDRARNAPTELLAAKVYDAQARSTHTMAGTPCTVDGSTANLVATR